MTRLRRWPTKRTSPSMLNLTNRNSMNSGTSSQLLTRNSLMTNGQPKKVVSITLIRWKKTFGVSHPNNFCLHVFLKERSLTLAFLFNSKLLRRKRCSSLWTRNWKFPNKKRMLDSLRSSLKSARKSTLARRALSHGKLSKRKKLERNLRKRRKRWSIMRMSTQ